MFDVLVRGGEVIDGTGVQRYRADVGIRDGRIVAISRVPLDETDAAEVINATNRVVAPGFIDMHTHCDWVLPGQHGMQNFVGMGVTTVLVGQCGGSPYPRVTPHGPFIEMIAPVDELGPGPLSGNWQDLAGWREYISSAGLGVNLAPFVGHTTLRQIVMGPEGQGGERVSPTPEQLKELQRLTAEAMEQGAFGMTTGLVYPPARNALPGEVHALATTAARYGGVYLSHQRSEGNGLLQATEENLEVARRSNMAFCISHLGESSARFPGLIEQVLSRIDAARGGSGDILFDFKTWTVPNIRQLGFKLYYALPLESRPPSQTPAAREFLLAVLGDDSRWASLKERVHAIRKEEEVGEAAGARRMEPYGLPVEPISRGKVWGIVFSPSHPELQGQTLAEAMEVFGVDDPDEALRRLYLADGGRTLGGMVATSESDLKLMLSYPTSTFGTDALPHDGLPDLSLPGIHSLVVTCASWGTFPKVLGEWVREKRWLGLEAAVRKMTGLPARFLGLRNRGLVKLEYAADLVLFDPLTIGDQNTPREGVRHSPTGIHHVLVNGKVAMRERTHTKSHAGQVLSRT